MMKTSLRKKYWSFLAMLPLTYLIGVLMVEISPFFLIPFLVLFLISSIGLVSLECGNCGEPLLYRAKQALGVTIFVWRGKLPKKCPKCDMPV